MIDLPSRRRSGKARLHQQHRKESQLRFHTHHKAFAFPFFRISFGSFFIIVTVLSPFNLYFLLFLLSPSHHHLSIFHEIKIIKLNSQWQTDWRGRFKWWRGEGMRAYNRTCLWVYETGDDEEERKMEWYSSLALPAFCDAYKSLVYVNFWYSLCLADTFFFHLSKRKTIRWKDRQYVHEYKLERMVS